jgi:hypothetical protein
MVAPFGTRRARKMINVAAIEIPSITKAIAAAAPLFNKSN